MGNPWSGNLNFYYLAEGRTEFCASGLPAGRKPLACASMFGFDPWFCP